MIRWDKLEKEGIRVCRTTFCTEAKVGETDPERYKKIGKLIWEFMWNFDENSKLYLYAYDTGSGTLTMKTVGGVLYLFLWIPHSLFPKEAKKYEIFLAEGECAWKIANKIYTEGRRRKLW